MLNRDLLPVDGALAVVVVAVADVDVPLAPPLSDALGYMGTRAGLGGPAPGSATVTPVACEALGEKVAMRPVAAPGVYAGPAGPAGGRWGSVP